MAHSFSQIGWRLITSKGLPTGLLQVTYYVPTVSKEYAK